MARKIAYLGPAGTYTEQAAIAYDPSAERVPQASVAAVSAAVESGSVEEGIVAIENSLEGSVTDVLDLLIHDSTLKIRKEVVIPINHCLLVKPGTVNEARQIQVLYSHPQAFGQCRKYIEAALPAAEVFATLSTVAAVEELMGIGRFADHVTGPRGKIQAAIAPKRSAELYDAEILMEGIQDHSRNATRFVVLASLDHEPTGDDKTSIAFTFDEEDKPGQIYRAMSEFASWSINLSRVESRPSKESLGRYVFLIDLDGHRTDPGVREALEAIDTFTSTLKIFGSYPRYRASG
jgi:prephenate dehydratase